MSEMSPEAVGEFVCKFFGAADHGPGPPYVHTLVPPEPIGWDEDGDPIWPELHPSFTLTLRPVADVVREAGFGPAPERVEVTYCTEFCGDDCTCSLAGEGPGSA